MITPTSDQKGTSDSVVPSLLKGISKDLSALVDEDFQFDELLHLERGVIMTYRICDRKTLKRITRRDLYFKSDR